MRAQAHTLESIMAGVLLIGSIVFALQATAVTPLSASTSSQHIENQQQANAEGLLATVAQDGALKRAILYWDDGNDEFPHADNSPYYTDKPPKETEFGAALYDAYHGSGIAYNVYFSYQPPGGGRRHIRWVYRGVPSDNAVRVTQLVTVYDSDPLYHEDGGEIVPKPGTSVKSSGFYAQDIGSSEVFNVIRVEVVVWRM